MKRKTKQFVFLFCCLFLTSHIVFFNVRSNNFAFDDSSSSSNEYMINNSIDAEYSITNDQNFTDYGFSGSGTENSPYLIVDLVITTSKEYGVFIDNTTKHFKITNCSITAASSCVKIGLISYNTSTFINNTFSSCDFGIYFEDCENTRIVDNIFDNITSSGIYMFEAENVLILNNDFMHNEYGIRIQFFSNLDIINNIFTSINHAGIYLNDGNNILISLNDLYGGEYTIRVRGCSIIEITDNTCTSGNYGIYVTESSDCIVTLNACNSYYTSAIYIHRSSFTVIEYNIVNNEHNPGDGITCYESDNCSLKENDCMNTDFGIYLQLSNSVLIQDNYISNNFVGLVAVSSDYLEIKINTFDSNTEGIQLIYSEDSIISSNSISNGNLGIHLTGCSLINCKDNICHGDMYGIYFEETENSNVIDNLCFNYMYGIFIKDSDFSLCVNNTCSFNEYGIYLKESDYSLCNNNTCSFNNLGIYLDDTDYCSFMFNSIFNSTYDGIFLKTSSHNLIQRNEIFNNTYYGINIWTDSNNNTIVLNRFITNYAFSNYSQANDNGTQNWWYDKELKIGNYWYNHTSSKPYLIDGSAESVDKYPLDENLVRIKGVSYSLIPLLSVLLVISLVRLSFKRRRKEKTT